MSKDILESFWPSPVNPLDESINSIFFFDFWNCPCYFN